jgi:hypothetical protein
MSPAVLLLPMPLKINGHIEKNFGFNLRLAEVKRSSMGGLKCFYFGC